MKCWLLIFAVAVWLQLPSEGEAKHLAPVLRAVSTSKLAHLAKRHQLAQEKRGASSEEMNKEIAEFLNSDEVASMLGQMGITMDMVNEMVDSDDEIAEDEKELFKFILVMTLAGADLDELAELNSIERSMKRKTRNSAPLLKIASASQLEPFVKRHQLAREKRGASSEEMNQEIEELLQSDECAEMLAEMGISLDMINDMVDNDPDVPEDEKNLYKLILIMAMAGIDLDDIESLDDRAVFKQK